MEEGDGNAEEPVDGIYSSVASVVRSRVGRALRVYEGKSARFGEMAGHKVISTVCQGDEQNCR